MNIGDKNKRMNIRFTDEQYDFINEMAEVTGLNPSDYIRMMVNYTMVQYRKLNISDKINDAVEQNISNIENALNYEMEE